MPTDYRTLQARIILLGKMFCHGYQKKIGNGKSMFVAFLSSCRLTALTHVQTFDPGCAQLLKRAYTDGQQLNSYYLLLLGVRQSEQGKGLGSMLFSHVQDLVSAYIPDQIRQANAAPGKNPYGSFMLANNRRGIEFFYTAHLLY